VEKRYADVDANREAMGARRGTVRRFLWPSLVIGAGATAAGLLLSVNLAAPTAFPFAVVEYLVIWLPLGLAYGLLVFLCVAACRRFLLKSFSQSHQRAITAILVFLIAGVGSYLALPTGPVSFSQLLFGAVIGAVFAVTFAVRDQGPLAPVG